MSLSAVATLPAPRQRVCDVPQVIANLRRQNPRASEGRLTELLAEELMDNHELLHAVAGDLVHRALTPVRAKGKPTIKAAETARRQRVANQEAEKQVVKAVAAKVKETLLLDLVMPNGIAMRFCTGRQMLGFGHTYQAVGE